ncbi:hypothetical protein DUNSADRAFT_12708 [Dunaliella salina]|uniref:Encoded protein n=1 Tax=Dunaliella salina TaxID=3046 RepID=A0ABQ7GAX3_DUNSA|nr:hypothetical protein DUNSADRAFT_12708 [Dunaliella salina]|eukprot:KAF5831713.1 hypothetical protein DUNSADRAFT_12708 [Dunaliella salina]
MSCHICAFIRKHPVTLSCCMTCCHPLVSCHLTLGCRHHMLPIASGMPQSCKLPQWIGLAPWFAAEIGRLCVALHDVPWLR